ncbi:MAG: phenylalanine--tRNA ligase subunit beta, partial [Opitutaceae bacterium]
PSPEWLQRALTSIGLRPSNNIVDVTNFVLLETGQPLHAFDAKKIHGPRLVIRFANDGERIVTLDGKERSLATNNLVIADAERALVVAGIMGGADAEVDETTVDLVLESAYFRPLGVRRTSKFLQLSSDSSYRFERGVDARGVLPAARRAIDLILEVAGGRVLGPVHIAGSEPVSENEIQLSPGFVRARCGFEISDDEQKDTLARLELAVVREDEDDEGRKAWHVSIPSWRGDLERPIDLVEEILRVYGTERIPATQPVFRSVISADDPLAVFLRRAAGVLAGRGFSEAVNYTLRSENEVKRTASRAALSEFRVANPLAEDQSHLRHSLIPGLLETVRFNQTRGNLEGLFFETGRTFREENGAVYEMLAAAFVIAQPEQARAWSKRERADFFTAKRLVLDLAAAADVRVRDEVFQLIHASRTLWQPEQAAIAGSFMEGFEFRVGLVDLGYTRELGINGPVLAGVFEILPERLKNPGGIARYKPVSSFPAATRDLALVCGEDEPAGRVQASLVKVARKALDNAFALEKAELFDVYRGKGLPESKKSLAFSLTFRASDRTLKDEEVNKVFTAVQQEMEAAGYAVRKG